MHGKVKEQVFRYIVSRKQWHDKIRVWQAPQLRLNYKRTSQRQTINEYKIDEMTNQRHKDNSTDQQQEQANSENCGPLPGNNFDLKVCQRSRSRHCVNWKGLSQGSTCQISMLIINTWEDIRRVARRTQIRRCFHIDLPKKKRER